MMGNVFFWIALTNDVKINRLEKIGVYQIAKIAYTTILRDLLLQAVEATDNDYDDLTVALLDKIFGYE